MTALYILRNRMLIIRLARFGRKKQPSYRLIINEKTKDTHGDYLEQLGIYNPRTQPKTIEFNAERIQYWISKGAQTSETVHNLLVAQGIIKGDKLRKGRTTKKLSEEEKAKLAEEAKAAAEKAKAEKEAAAAPAEEKTEETPAEAPAVPAEEKSAPGGSASEGKEEAPAAPAEAEKKE